VCHGAHYWSKRYGDEDTQSVSSIAVDSVGNLLLVGEFKSTVNLGGGNLTSAGNYDVLLGKLDASGNHLWSKRFGDSGWQVSSGIAADNSGNVIITGYFYDTINFGGGNLVSLDGLDIFVAKFDAAGNHIWSKRFGSSNDQYSFCIAVDDSGDVFLSGLFGGLVNFGGETLSSAGSWDVFVVKLDSAGNHIWSKSFGDASAQYSRAIAVDSYDNVLFAGYFEGTVNFGGGNLVSAGGEDVFVTKLDAAGDHVWSKRFGDASDQYANAIAMDGLGHALVAGYFLAPRRNVWAKLSRGERTRVSEA